MATLDISNTALANKFRKEGRSEGRSEGQIETILEQGRDKFGEPLAEVRAEIESIADDVRLRGMIKRMLHANSWKELMG